MLYLAFLKVVCKKDEKSMAVSEKVRKFAAVFIENKPIANISY